MALVLIGAVADFAESVEEYGVAERILLLTLVEADVATTTQLGVLQPSAALYCRVSTAEQTCARQETGPTRLRQKGWLQNRRGLEGNRLRAKQERAERKKILALAQARKVDVILVTELTPPGPIGQGSPRGP